MTFTTAEIQALKRFAHSDFLKKSMCGGYPRYTPGDNVTFTSLGCNLFAINAEGSDGNPPYLFDNGLHLDGQTAKLGGRLIEDTTVGGRWLPNDDDVYELVDPNVCAGFSFSLAASNVKLKGCGVLTTDKERGLNLIGNGYSGGFGTDAGHTGVYIEGTNSSYNAFTNADQFSVYIKGISNIPFESMPLSAYSVGIEGNRGIILLPHDSLQIRALSTNNSCTQVLGNAGSGFCKWMDISSISGGVSIMPEIDIINYGDSYSAAAVALYNVHIVLSGAGSGTSTIDVTNASTGSIFIVSDLDLKAGANDIVVDSGSGNVIVGTTALQTYILNSNGDSVTLQKISSTKWKII